MSEFLPRTVPVAPVASALERGPFVRPQRVTRATDVRTEVPDHSAPILTERSAAAADYARLKADIADVLARISAPSSPEPVGSAEQTLMGLMPQPVIMLPLPPTDPQIVQFVAQVAQSLAERTAQTRAAQANVTPLMLEAAAA